MQESILHTSNINKTLTEVLDKIQYSKIGILVDENTKKYCLPQIPTGFKNNVIEIPSGESHKNLETCDIIWQKLTEFQFDRKSILVNLGGGVICDIGAFCASTFKRGISFIHIPTTLLAMTDAAIGGKTGVNFGALKNHIGLFSEPEYVLIDPLFLETLSSRELRSGYAEIIKHGIIKGAILWDLANYKESQIQEWQILIKHSSQVKKDIVEKDFLETGERKKLNLGHSIGHQLESYSFYSDQAQKLHGEAIAEGIIVEAFIAYKKNLLPEKALKEICDRISGIFAIEKIDSSKEAWIEVHLVQDKKNQFEKLNFSLPEGIGKVHIDCEVSYDEVKQAIHLYNDYLS